MESGASPIGDLPVINAIPQNLDGSNGTNTDMEKNLNNSMVSNLVNNVQEADFQEQLKGLDDELKKYDNVEGFKETQATKSLEEGSGQSMKQTLCGLKSLGLDLSSVTAHDEGKIKSRG